MLFAAWRDQRTAQELGESEGMATMRWNQVVHTVNDLFGRHGYEVRKGANEGVDLVLEKDLETVLVSCDQWAVWTVDTSPLFELYQRVRQTGANGGILLTTGAFTEEALDFASATGIEVVDGTRLENLVLEAGIAA